MKQKKMFLIILLCLLFLPFIVNAEECDITKITITSMEQKGIEGNTKEVEEPTFNDRSINFNLKMFEVGDAITYDMTIKNDSDEDYMIDEDTFKTDSEYIVYTLKTNDGDNVVKARGSKNVTLIVEYKKEVDSSLLSNNKFDASNSLKLSLNTSEKEGPLDVITTDNIEEIKNPLTGNRNIRLICLILLISLTIIYLTYHNKKKYNRYLILILPIALITTVYATCKCDIEVESTVEIEKLPKLNDIIVGLASEDNACVTKYEGDVTDEVNKTVNATNVYYDKCSDKNNVIFGNYCWVVFRTTETAGTKILYNGKPIDGKCDSSREYQSGFIMNDYSSQEVASNYLYGSSFSYNEETGIFTLEDTVSSIWSDISYKDLLGKYTCKSNDNSCSSLYFVDDYNSSTEAYLLKITIGDIYYTGIGYGPYNTAANSMAKVGYMYNNRYNHYEKHPQTTYKYGSGFIYDSVNNKYTLSGEIKELNDWYHQSDELGTSRYTCWNQTGECTTISYIYTITYNRDAFYVDINNGKGIDDVLDDMLFDSNVNKHDSNIKSVIDQWYKNNMLHYSDYLEDAVYCNNRRILDLGPWNKNNLVRGGSLTFGNDSETDLTCHNLTDQFSVSNNKAKLKYPIALITNPEMLGTLNVFALYGYTDHWGMSPWSYSDNSAVKYYTIGSYYSINYTDSQKNIRPVISLKNSNIVVSGTGSESDPWIIKD